MKITLTELPFSLKRNLASFYWLSGEDAILQEEALSLILNKAQEQGFTEKQHFTLTSQFEDPALWQALHNRSLWQDRKILLAHLNAGKLTQKGASHFSECLAGIHSDILLIIQSSKLENNQYQSAWYKAAEARGVFVNLWPLNEREWQKWLTESIKTFELKLDASGIDALLFHCEGNLLAAKNALRSLKLAYADQNIGEAEVLALLTPQGHYTLNQLTDAILQGKGVKAENILQHLSRQGFENNLIIWALLRELRLLTLFSGNPLPTDAELSAYKLWPQRKASLQQAAKRLPYAEWQALFKKALRCDKILKGVLPGEPELILSHLVCTMSTAKTPFAFTLEV